MPSPTCLDRWWFGPTGLGQSGKAFETYMYGEKSAYVKMSADKWWDGYMGQVFVKKIVFSICDISNSN
jgi:hypothetical protein